MKLSEEMKWGHPQLAILEPVSGTIVAYKANEKTRKELQEYILSDDAIIGIIEFSYHGPVARINRVFAVKGFGPILYFMTNTNAKYIAPDKHDVSADAKKIWKRFFTDGTKKKPFDSDHPEEYLNYAYRLDAIKINQAKAILNNGKLVSNMFVTEFEFPDEIESHIWETADMIAMRKMREIYG